MRIVVTGSASHLAQVLLPLLAREQQITQVIGLDINQSDFHHPKFTEHHIDIRDEGLAQHLEGADAAIHLAFVVMRGNLKQHRHDRGLMHDINLNGSINLFRAAQRHRIKHLIHLSSASVYGAWPDNPAQMDESQPLRAMHGFAYAEDKVSVEQWLNHFTSEEHAPRITILRPHVILGPNAQPLLIQLLKQPFYPRLPEPQPLSQCVWEEDVADAILLALLNRHDGIFNLAADAPISFKEMQQRLHQRSIGLPYPFVRWLHRLLWSITGYAGEPGWVDGMRYSLAITNNKAKEELGWKPRYTTAQCLDKLFKEQ